MGAAILLAAGCAGPDRPTRTEAQFAVRASQAKEQSGTTYRDAIGRSLERIASRPEDGCTINVLALSGGGDFGAFGAGFLAGWGSAPGDFRRPDFDIVTGVSTGALLAPYAMLGTDEAIGAIETLYRNPRSDWLETRGLLFFLPMKPSFMRLPGLERDIRKSIDHPMVAQLAEESREGKVLIISATDLDIGRQHYWDLGAEAAAATDEAGIDRVHRILLASAAIPAVFPPVEIDDGLYADGGVTANVFLRLDPRNPDSFIPRWVAAYPDRPLPRLRYWIIINNQLEQPPNTVQPRWPEIIGPSLATAIRSATLAEVRWLTAQADYVNLAYGVNVEIRVVSIPDEWRAPVKGDFKKETMEALADLGRAMGADPSSWTLWASPATAKPPGTR